MNPIPTLNPLLDLDPVVYAAGFSADAEIRADLVRKGLSPEQVKEEMDKTDYLAHALNNAKQSVEFILNDVFPQRRWYRAFLSGKGNFRVDVATIQPYKGNRDPNHKPKYFKEIRDYLIDVWKAEVVEGQEADDAIGICQYSHKDKSTVICSIDKDLTMIPGYHFNPRNHGFWYQSLEDADRFFWWQMMVGDTTDHIPGIRKVGPKTADKIVEANPNLADLRQVVEEMYQKQYGDKWQDCMREVAQLLWIRRQEGRGPDV